MTVADQPFRALFGSIGLLFVGFMAIICNKGGAKAIIFMINEPTRFIFPNATKISFDGTLFKVFRVLTTMIGILDLILAFFILRQFIWLI